MVPQMVPVQLLTRFAADRPRVVFALVVVITVLAVLASLGARIDTDPENMLEPDQPDRVVYDRMKRDFGLSDVLVVGVVDARGIFRPESLERIVAAIEEITQISGVIAEDVVSLTTTDAARVVDGLVEIRPVLEDVPRDARGMEQLRALIAADPFLHEKIASSDGDAVAIYVPIRSKDQSYRIAGSIREILARTLLAGQTVHLAGLPVAEDTFGHEMFVEMAVVAPLAFLGILLLVFLLFGELLFLVPVALIALISIIWTMGALIGTGNTVHIMSSMIPVFLMPIAILDAVHVLSEYRDRAALAAHPMEVLQSAMAALARPMFFTSVTSAVGFASLALAPIPPVRVFGLFVALGIAVAWLLTHTLLPALFAVLPLARAGSSRTRPRGAGSPRANGEPMPPRGRRVISRLDPLLGFIGRASFHRAPIVLATGGAMIVAGLIGASRLRSDDNPVRWFRPGHPVRQAHDVLNARFGGTYMAHVIARGDAGAAQRPEFLRYLERIQQVLERDRDVGKTSSVADIVRRLNRVLHDDDPAHERIPDTEEAVGQILFIYQGSGDLDDLDTFLERDARQANVWVQMRSGDNASMGRVEASLAAYVREDPPPEGVVLEWSGLNHINRVWQELMVAGMGRAVLGSFGVVFLLMVLEFRSWRFGALAMIPLTTAIVFSYGIVGLIGKPYDMPIAVCSSLSLGLAVDFAIHFLERWRVTFVQTRDLADANLRLFGAPARAIARNAIVISIGFLPLLASTLTPYVTVSLFFAAIMVGSALATLFLLPALLRTLGPRIV